MSTDLRVSYRDGTRYARVKTLDVTVTPWAAASLTGVSEDVRELRLSVTAPDYDDALRFYRDVLGLREIASYASEGGHVTILAAGRATLEIADPVYAAYIDEVEVGARVAGHLRVAFEVADAAPTTESLAAAGATVVADTVRTPWGSLNARLDAPGGLHVTVFSQDVHVRGKARLDGPVHLADPDPGWPGTAQERIAAIRGALGDRVLMLEHAGSTSVPGLPAKPLIDLVLAVANSADEESYLPALEAAGYELRVREPEWHEHRTLKHLDPEVNLHVFSLGSDEIDRMLAFRDHLRDDPRDRDLYAATKADLAARTWAHVQDYADAKSEVVADVMSRALRRTARPADAFVLVSGQPGESTLARDLAARLGLPHLDQETLTLALTADQAAGAVLALAARLRGAVLAGDWGRGHAAGVDSLPGAVVEVVCGAAPPALPVGGIRPVLEVDPTAPVDVACLARQVRQLTAPHS